MTQLNSSFNTLSLLQNLTPKKVSDVFSQATYQRYNSATGNYENIPIIPGEQGLEREQKQITDRLVGLISSGLQADLTEIESKALIEQREGALRFLERFGARKETEWFGDRVSETTLSFPRGQEPVRGGMQRDELSRISGYASGERGILGLEQSSQGAQAMLSMGLVASKSTVDQDKFGQGSEKERERLRRQSDTFTYPGKVIDVVTTGEDVLSVIPFLSHGALTVHDSLLKKDPNFKAEDLLNAYAAEDPDFMAFLKQTNMDLTALAGTRNLEHFNYVLNTHYANISLSESMKAYEETSTTLGSWSHFAWDQVKASFGSIDFGGQVLLAVATAGVGNAIALGATAASATASRTLSTGAQVARTISVADKLSRIGKGVRTVGDYLPLNLPTTVLKKVGWEAAEGTLKYGSGFVIGHMITGFAEETMTDILNQSVEKYGYKTRVGYDYWQMVEAGALGAVMEPILGAGFRGPAVLLGLISPKLNKYGKSIFDSFSTKVLNVNPARIEELALFRESLMPKDAIKNMTQEERNLYVATTARMIAVESLLNESTNNTFGKIEDNASSVSLIQAILSSAQSDFTGNQQSLVEIAFQLDGLLKRMNANMRTVDGKWQRASRQMELENPNLFTENSNGDVVLTKEGAETLMVALAAETVANPSQRTQVVAEAMNGLIRRRIAEKVKEENDTEESLSSKIDQELENDTDTAKAAKSSVMNVLKVMETSFTLRTADPESADLETAVTEQRSQDVVDAEQKAQADVVDLVNEAIGQTQVAPTVVQEAAPKAAEAAPKAAEAAPKAAEAAPKAAFKADESVRAALRQGWLDRKRRRDNKAIPIFVSNLIYALNKNLISPLEVSMLLRKLAPLKTREQAEAFLQWIMAHKNKEFAKLMELGITDAILYDVESSVKEFFEDLQRIRPDLVEDVVSDSVGATSKTSSVAPQAESSVTPTATPTTERQAEPGAMNGFVGNLLFALEKGLISDVEVDFLLRKLARVETEEQASQFLKWMMSHKNKEIAKILELPMNESIFSAPKNSVKMIFSLLQKSKPELVKGIVPESETTSPSVAPRVAQVAPKTTPTTVPEVTSTATPTDAPAVVIPATMDMARALETLKAHPELVKLLNIICK